MGLGTTYVSHVSPAGALIDVDGDDDLDLFAFWEILNREVGFKEGWALALNDGAGAFERVYIYQVEADGRVEATTTTKLP